MIATDVGAVVIDKDRCTVRLQTVDLPATGRRLVSGPPGGSLTGRDKPRSEVTAPIYTQLNRADLIPLHGQKFYASDRFGSDFTAASQARGWK
jgi:hypothetical protein